MLPINDRQRLAFLILILATVGAFIAGVTTTLLYRAAFQQNRERLLVSAQSQARIIEAVARFDEKYSTDYPKGPAAATISQIAEAHENFELFGETGEFTIAQREGDRIVFLFRRRHRHVETPKPISIDSELAAPMRQALSGRSGTLIGLDYRGESVLAAFEPVAVLNLGIVAKIDMAEIRAPFIRTGIIAVAMAILSIVVGAFFFVRTTNPMIRRIQESEARYRDLVETSQDLIFMLDREGRFTYVSPACEKTLDYKQEEMIGRKFTEFKSEAEAERSFRSFKQVLSGGSVTDFESVYLSKAGEERILSLIIIPKFDLSGEIVGTQGTAYDVTERKRDEDALRESEQKFRSLVEQAADALFVHDSKGRFVDANRAACKSLGYHRHELLTLSTGDVLVDYDPTRLQNTFRDIAAGKPVTREAKYRRKDGTTFPVEVSIGAVFLDGKKHLLVMARDITERNEAAEALRKSRELEELAHAQLADAIESHPGTFALFDAEDRLVVSNRKNLEFFPPLAPILKPGIRYEDAVRQFLAAGIYEVDPGGEEAFVQKRLQERKEKTGVIEERLTDGRWFAVYHRPTSANGTVSIRLDITERKRAQEHFRGLAEGSIQGIIVHRDFKVLFANQAMADLIGYDSVQEILEIDFSELPFYAPIEKGWVRENVAARERGENPPNRYDVQGIKKDGTPFWMELLATVVPWDGVLAIQVTYADITERKRAEEELRQGRQMLQTLIDALPVWVTVKDTDLRYQWVNQRLLDDLQVSRQQCIGSKNFLSSPTVWKRAVTLDREVLATGKRGVIEELRHPFPNGEFRVMHHIKVPWTDGGGEIRGIVTASMDITERKQLEAQLQQAQKMEAVGTLAGGIAHNFNNLLQVILSNISLLRMGIEPGPALEEILARIENRVKHGESLTGQLLGLARGGKYQVKAVNLAPLVANAADMFGASHQEIEIQQNLEPALWNVRCDEGQIEQVLLNLFVNAQQAMAGGGRLILQGENVTLGSEFSEVHDAAPGRYVKISVSDSGIGMGQETLARVFEPFFTTKEMTHGSGLGLSSTYGIIRNHDGIITVESEIGRGTTFDIYLPATDGQIEEIKQSPPVKTPKGEGTVLFVDDEEGLVYGARRELAILGYDALVAKSGREAIEVYRKNIGKVDLVILDMIMPGMGGGEVFDQLKELDPNVKVILSSGYSLAGEAEEIMGRGCGAFLQKPFDINELAGKIHEVLNRG